MSYEVTEEDLATIRKVVAELVAEDYGPPADIRKDEEENQDKFFRNTKLLLKNYRKMKEDAKHVPLIEDQLLFDIETEIFGGNKDIDVILQSKQKSAAMLQYVDASIDAYKKICTSYAYQWDGTFSNNAQLADSFRVMKWFYLDYYSTYKPRIADNPFGITRSHFYRQLEKATKDLSVILFGIDSTVFD